MAWRWTGAKPLSGTVKPYHELDPSEQEQTNINFPSKYNNFTKENDYEMLSAKCQSFCLDLSVLA